tara:strand:+ start:16281 stop:16508 length:228 start_codon:yes stop_codon:yes gene_type:complete
VANLITRNDKLQSTADALLQSLIDAGEDIKISDLVSVRESAFKQNQLLTGKATEKITYTIESFEQAKEALKDILK